MSADITQSTTLDETMSNETPSSQRHETPRRDQADDLDLTELGISSHSTPRAPGGHHQADDDITTSSMEYSSSYENLRRQVNESEPPFDLPESSTLPSTPGRQLFFPRGVSVTTPMSSPFLPPAEPSTQDRRYQKTSDPVLHQMLDKTYRVQATPLGKGFRNVGGGTNTRPKFNITPKPAESTSKYRYDDSPISSPEPEAPQLHSEVFSSPIKGIDTPGTNRKRRTSSNRMRGIPRPGMSVLTPAKKSAGKSAMWDSDDDLDYDDEDLGPSPPKTMQFHIPQSRLMRTPGNKSLDPMFNTISMLTPFVLVAREASKRIVTDLLATAGAGEITDDFSDDQSPSVIRRMEHLEDETF